MFALFSVQICYQNFFDFCNSPLKLRLSYKIDFFPHQSQSSFLLYKSKWPHRSVPLPVLAAALNFSIKT